MAKKSNLKSVRISDEVMEYIQNFEGDGFNQKFENLVLFCMKEEGRKRKTIVSLDSDIRKKLSQLRCLDSLSYQSEKLVTLISQFNTQVNQFNSLLANLDDLPF